MLYRPLGRTGVKVSALCLGTVKFGKPTPDEECYAIIDRAIDAGINIIDTAYVYGRSEEIIGAALARNGKRDCVLLATKIQPQANDRRTVITQCEHSLQRLQTDVIDLLQLHRPAPWIPIDETLRALDDLVQAGKVRYIGTSGFKAWQITEAICVARELGRARVVTEQCVYSLLSRWIEDELVPMAETYGLTLLLWSPLGAGILTNRYTRANPPAHAELDQRCWQIIDELRAVAREKGRTASQLALAWCLHQSDLMIPIAGPRTFAQLEDNLGAVDVELAPADMQRLDAVSPPGWTAREHWLGLQFGVPHTL